MSHSVRFNRRHFVAGAAAAGMVVVKPSHVRGTAANSQIEVACIGLGGRGRLVAKKIAAHGGFQITGIADYFPEVAEAAAADHSVPRARTFSGLSGYKRVIDSGIDAVVLETPPYCFPDHARAAVEAGCHVYMAKPVAIDVPGCLTIRSLGQRATQDSRVFFVDFQMRVDPHLIECVKRVHDGVLGDLRFIRCFYDDNGFPDPPLTDTVASRFRHLVWVNDIALGGGKLVNAGIHAMDAALWIIGSTPTSCAGDAVVARQDPHGDAVDCYSLTYEFADGPLMNYSGQHYPNLAGFHCGYDAYGKAGYLEARYGKRNWIRGGQRPYEGGETPEIYQFGIEQNLKTFHQRITTGCYSNETVAPSVNANLATILGREAALSGRHVTWDDLIRDAKPLRPNLQGLKD
jgi:predicted dehydrogenase